MKNEYKSLKKEIDCLNNIQKKEQEYYKEKLKGFHDNLLFTINTQGWLIRPGITTTITITGE